MSLKKLDRAVVLLASVSVYYITLLIVAVITSPTIVYTVSAAPLPVKISFCTNDKQIEHALVEALNEWTTAVKIFSIKYLWLQTLNMVFTINENPCTVYVSWSHELKPPYLAYTTFNGTYHTYISATTSDSVLNIVMKHEVSRVLGVMYAEPLTPVAAEYMPAAVSSYYAEVTSYDVYAVSAKLSGSYGVLTAPKYLPYQSAKDLRPDFLAATCAVLFYGLIQHIRKQH